MTKSRFIVLDGMRGVAAIAVMLYHFFPQMPGSLLHHSYLAVDLFFLLSGFVIAYTYEEKLRSGLSFGGFALARAIRLYPLVIASVLGVAALRLLYPILTWPTGEFLYELLMNGLLLPNSLNSLSERFVFLPPSWSLFYELVINLVYAAFLPFLPRKALVGVIVGAGITLAVLAYQHGSVGLLHHSIPAGLVRTAFSFFVGVLICRDIGKARTASVSLPVSGQYAILVILLTFPSVGAWNWLYDLATIFVAFPLMIALAVRQVSGGMRRVETELGEISYPVYVLHMPVLAYVGVALGWAGSDLAITASSSLLTLVAAALAWRLYDRPVRKWLSAHLRRPDLQHKLRAEP